MPSFLLAEIDVTDPEMYREYVRKASPIVRDHGGEYILRSDSIAPLTGDWTPRRLVLIRFDSRADMQACFSSQEYRQIKHLREQSTTSRSVVIEQEADAGEGS